MGIFDKINENEKNILILKQTKINTFIFLFSFFAVILIYFLLIFFEVFSFNPIILIIFLIYFFIILFFLIIKNILSKVLFTNMRLIFFEKKDFLTYFELDLNLSEIKEIKYKKVGFFQNTFNFGNIEILTENKNYFFKNIINPSENIKEILALIK